MAAGAVDVREFVDAYDNDGARLAAVRALEQFATQAFDIVD